MNLQPITPPTPLFFFRCAKCEQGFASDNGMADLSAFPGTFYCVSCAAHPRRFAHDCAVCRFIGYDHDTRSEWYYCANALGSPGGSVVGRYGPEPPDYWSCPVDIIKTAEGAGSACMQHARHLVREHRL